MIGDKKIFKFKKKYSSDINFCYYDYDVLFKSSKCRSYFNCGDKYKIIMRGRAILRIRDDNNIFYMYIKLGIFITCPTCDGDNKLDYRIIYGNSFEGLLKFVYKFKMINRLLIKPIEKEFSNEIEKYNILSKIGLTEDLVRIIVDYLF